MSSELHHMSSTHTHLLHVELRIRAAAVARPLLPGLRWLSSKDVNRVGDGRAQHEHPPEPEQGARSESPWAGELNPDGGRSEHEGWNCTLRTTAHSVEHSCGAAQSQHCLDP